MSGIFTQELRLKNRDVDMYRRLRTSKLFELLQEASIAHTEALGMGREKTLDRGLLWVVALQRAEIRRLPEYDELIRVQTWPGETMHVLFPRYYEILSEQGETIVRASAVWSLMDAAARSAVFPEEHGISIPGEERGGELEFQLGVDVPFTSLCPCSKEISQYGAHNQRSVARVQLRFQKGVECIYIEDLADLVEKQGSSPIYPLLKREDEKFVTEAAYENPKFVEDILRDTVLAMRGLEGLAWFSIECENYESIHNQNMLFKIKLLCFESSRFTHS